MVSTSEDVALDRFAFPRSAPPGRLLGYMERGPRAEAYDGALDDADVAAKTATKTKLPINLATKTIVGLSGPATIPLDIASSVVQAGIDSEKLSLPEEASEINADNLATQRAYRMLEAVVAKDPSMLDGPDGSSIIPENLRGERGLRPRAEILDDESADRDSVVLRSAAEEFLHRRGLEIQRFDLPLNSARDNQSGYATDEAHYRSRIMGGVLRDEALEAPGDSHTFVRVVLDLMRAGGTACRQHSRSVVGGVVPVGEQPRDRPGVPRRTGGSRERGE